MAQNNCGMNSSPAETLAVSSDHLRPTLPGKQRHAVTPSILGSRYDLAKRFEISLKYTQSKVPRLLGLRYNLVPPPQTTATIADLNGVHDDPCSIPLAISKAGVYDNPAKNLPFGLSVTQIQAIHNFSWCGCRHMQRDSATDPAMRCRQSRFPLCPVSGRFPLQPHYFFDGQG